jgi:hypothetical protein
VADRADDRGDGLPERRLEEPEPGADLVDHARAYRTHRVGLPERRDLGVEPGDDPLAAERRQPGVVEGAQAARDPLVRSEHRPTRRLGRVRGEHGLDVESGRQHRQLVSPDPGAREHADGLGNRLPCDRPLALVVPASSDTVVLLGDVGELEEEGERGQHRRLGLHVEVRDCRLEHGVVAACPRVARERADPLLERQQLLALLLDEHLPEQVPEEVDVGAEPLVGGGRAGHAASSTR